MNFNSHICASCGKEFSADIVEAIPICPQCAVEEQVTTFTPQGARPQKTEIEDFTVTQSVEKPTDSEGWYVRKTDGGVYGPFPQEILVSWFHQGKILATEEVKQGYESTDWQVFSQCHEFASFFTLSEPEEIDAADFPLTQGYELPPEPFKEPVREAIRPGAIADDRSEIEPAELQEEPFAFGMDDDEDDSKLFEDRPRFSFPFSTRILKKILIGGFVLAGCLILLLFVAKIPWNSLAEKFNQVFSKSSKDFDRVEAYIENYAKELGPVSGDANQYYEQGIRFFRLETLQGLNKAETLFKRTLVLDHDHVGALAGLASTYSEWASREKNVEIYTLAYDLAYKALAINAQDYRAHLAVARFLIRVGNEFQKAKEHLDFVLAQRPDDAMARGLLAQWHLLRSGRSDRDIQIAIEEFNRSKQLNPSLWSNYYFLGLAFLEEHAYARAFRVLSRVNHSGQDVPLFAARSQFELAKIQFLLGNYAEAKKYLDEALLLDQNHIESHILLTDLLIHYLKSPAVAERHILRFMQRRNENFQELDYKQILNMLALAQREQGKLTAAKASLEKLLQRDAYDRFGRYNKALVLIDMGETNDALRHLNDLQEWNKKPSLFHFSRGLALGSSDNRLKEAIQAFQSSLQAFPDLPHGHIAMANLFNSVDMQKRGVDVLFAAAQTDPFYMDTHQWRTPLAGVGKIPLKKAIALQEQYLRQNIHSVDAMTGYAYLMILNKKTPKALHILKRALEQDTRSTPALYLYGLLLIQAKQYDAVVQIMRSAIRFDLENNDLVLILARGYLGQNRIDLARERLEFLVSKDEVPTQAYYFLGRIYQAQNQKALAKEMWLTALKNDPGMIYPKRALFQSGH